MQIMEHAGAPMILPREALQLIAMMGEVCKRDDPFYEAGKMRGLLHSAVHLYLQAHSPASDFDVEEMYVVTHEAFERRVRTGAAIVSKIGAGCIIVLGAMYFIFLIADVVLMILFVVGKR